VNTTSDTVVVGACQNGSAGCSLRGAIQAANGHPGADGIEIDLPAGSTINLTQALPAITESVAITGPGADKLTVRRSTGGDYGIFHVTTSGTVSFSGITISNGRVSGFSTGGGISNENGIVTISSCAVIGNHAQVAGGGISNTATLNIRESTVSGNLNGGVANGTNGSMNITNCTISGNATGTRGGGVYNFSNIVNITNSTISGNFATDNATAGVAGGISNENGATVNIKSSIVAGNFNGAAPDVSGTFVSAGFNLIGSVDGGSGFTAATDQTGTIASPLDPKFDPDGLGHNGGPTRTVTLLPGSPALDKGTSNGLTGNLTTDQRGTGFPRIFDDPAIPNATGGNGADIGAFELIPPMGISRKLHGSVNFDINLPLTGTVGVECRTGGVNGDHQVIVIFPIPVTVSGVSVTSGTGNVSDFNVSGSQVTVDLTGVANAQTVVLTISGVSNGSSMGNVSIPMGVLLGDTNGNGGVNASDVSQTKARSGQPVDATNFRSDVSVNGTINASDVSLVKLRSGTALP
jgi:CSLREA domain-containing protein